MVVRMSSIESHDSTPNTASEKNARNTMLWITSDATRADGGDEALD